MDAPKYDTLSVGDELPALELPPVDRTTLALFAGASGDHNPIHIDIDFAKKAGMPDVIAHGMLSMAYLARFLTDWVPQSSLRSFSNRFTAITYIGDRITCTGKVAEKMEQDGEKRVRLEITAAKENGDVTLAGEAVVALG